MRGARVVETPQGDDRGVPHGENRSSPSRTLPAQGRTAQPGHRARPPVTCPLHNWVIELDTGKAQGADEGTVKTVPLKIGRGRLLLEAKAFWLGDGRVAGRNDARAHSHHLSLLRRRLRRARRRDAGRQRRVAGDPRPSGEFRPAVLKGSALGETLSLEDRLLQPMIDGRAASWDEALDLVASRFASAIAEHGPDSVAFYVSGQLLTEDYYVANKLMKGFIGSANIDTNSRLCMASSVAGHKRAFGADAVPGGYEDLELADLVVLVGSNLAWCHPVLFQRLLAAKEKRGTKIVVIDPRATATAEAADLHLPLAPGSDVALFNGLLAHLAANGAVDTRLCRAAHHLDLRKP